MHKHTPMSEIRCPADRHPHCAIGCSLPGPEEEGEMDKMMRIFCLCARRRHPVTSDREKKDGHGERECVGEFHENVENRAALARPPLHAIAQQSDGEVRGEGRRTGREKDESGDFKS